MVNDILQFTDISRPRVCEDNFHDFRGKTDDFFPPLITEFLQEMRGQKWNIVFSFTKGGNKNGNDIESVIKIFSEGAPLHLIGQIFVCRSDHPDVHLPGLLSPDPLKTMILQDPKEQDLGGRRNLANFIEEDRSPISHFKPANLSPDGPGERPFFMTEEFTFQQVLRIGRTISDDKGFVLPIAVEMNCPGDQLLSCSAFPLDEDSGIRIRNVRDQLKDLLHPGIFPEDVSETVSFLTCLGEENILILLPLQLVVEIFHLEHHSHLGQQFFINKWLREVVVRSQLEAVDLILQA